MADVQAFTSWSSTNANNSPSGSATIGSGLAPNLREIQAQVAAWRDGTGYGILTVTSVSGTNSITGSTSPAPTLGANQKYLFTPSATNTGAVVLALNGGSNKNVFVNGAALTGGELKNTVQYVLEYDGTQYNVLGGGLDGFANQTANTVLAGPTSGAAAQPTFRALTTADTLTTGAPVATTSGTTAGFSSLPAGLKRITFSLKGVSTNGTSTYLIQLSTGGTFKTSGYNGGAYSTGGSGTAASGSGFPITVNAIAANTYKGQIILALESSSNNTWTYVANILMESATNTPADFYTCAGDVSLSGTLDGIRLTTVSGDTFDAGEVNIVY